MAIIYADQVKNARLKVVLDFIDRGPGNAVLKIGTKEMKSILVVVELGKPSFKLSSGPSLRLSGTPLFGIARDYGEAASAEFLDSHGNVVISGLTVGTRNADIIIEDTDLSERDKVTVNSGDIVHG